MTSLRRRHSWLMVYTKRGPAAMQAKFWLTSAFLFYFRELEESMVSRENLVTQDLRLV